MPAGIPLRDDETPLEGNLAPDINTLAAGLDAAQTALAALRTQLGQLGSGSGGGNGSNGGTGSTGANGSNGAGGVPNAYVVIGGAATPPDPAIGVVGQWWLQLAAHNGALVDSYAYQKQSATSWGPEIIFSRLTASDLAVSSAGTPTVAGSGPATVSGTSHPLGAWKFVIDDQHHLTTGSDVYAINLGSLQNPMPAVDLNTGGGSDIQTPRGLGVWSLALTGLDTAYATAYDGGSAWIPYELVNGNWVQSQLTTGPGTVPVDWYCPSGVTELGPVVNAGGFNFALGTAAGSSIMTLLGRAVGSTDPWVPVGDFGGSTTVSQVDAFGATDTAVWVAIRDNTNNTFAIFTHDASLTVATLTKTVPNFVESNDSNADLAWAFGNNAAWKLSSFGGNDFQLTRFALDGTATTWATDKLCPAGTYHKSVSVGGNNYSGGINCIDITTDGRILLGGYGTPASPVPADLWVFNPSDESSAHVQVSPNGNYVSKVTFVPGAQPRAACIVNYPAQLAFVNL